MTKMFVLFIAALIANSLRWAIAGEYNPSQLQGASIVLLASLFFLWISIRQKHEDAAYSPTDSSRQWTTLLKDKLLTGEKKIFQGEELVATYNRYYAKSYHKMVADVMSTLGL